MQTIALSDCKNNAVQNRLNGIPFFSDMASNSKTEYDAVIGQSKLLILEPGEILLKKGADSSDLYTLLEGELDVFTDEPGDHAIGKLSGAQIFGALGTINHEPRTATLSASREGKAMAVAINQNVFGDCLDFSTISLKTKLILYNNVVNNTRWRLNNYLQTSNDPDLAQQLKSYPPYEGKKGTVEELQALADQAKGLGAILESWNEKTKPSIELPTIETATEKDSFFGNVKNLLFNK